MGSPLDARLPGRSPTHSTGALVMCVLTPPGRGAVATIAVAGARAAITIGEFFLASSGRAAVDLSVGSIHHGRWRTELGEEIVVCRKSADQFEIHCHGGPSAVKSIMEGLLAVGVQEIDWQTWTAQQTLGDIENDALVALAAARTERTASILLDQWQGALREELGRCLADCAQGDVQRTRDRLRELARHESLGLHLTKPYQVVLAGLPNVGKSSLINALMGYERTIVFDQPGTTRDVVTAETAIDGLPIALSDTAGLRSSDDPLEEAGVRRARERLVTSDLIVLVFDASTPSSIDEQSLRGEWPTALVVKNKCDLVEVDHLHPSSSEIRTSAVTGAGMGELLQAISRRLVPDWPAAGAAVPFTDRQVLAIHQALAGLDSQNLTLAVEVLKVLVSARHATTVDRPVN